jgi:hypothetical protein
VGIEVSIFILTILACLGWWLLRRRRQEGRVEKLPYVESKVELHGEDARKSSHNGSQLESASEAVELDGSQEQVDVGTEEGHELQGDFVGYELEPQEAQSRRVVRHLRRA